MKLQERFRNLDEYNESEITYFHNERGCVKISEKFALEFANYLTRYAYNEEDLISEFEDFKRDKNY